MILNRRRLAVTMTAIACLRVAALQLFAAAGSGLSPEDVRAAIDRGANGAGQEQGVVLIDVGRVLSSVFGQFAASIGPLAPGAQVLSTGFQVSIYTPFLWVARKASESPQLINSAAVDPELLRPVLHVVALPSLPPDTGPNSGSDVSPVVEVVLQDASHRNERVPTARRPFVQNGLRGLIVEFSLDDVAAVRGARPEFHIIVKGTNGNSKDFTVKKKHLAELRLD